MELSKNPNATIPTRACYYTSEISKKLSRTYIMHVPRFLIFKTMNNIRFLEFYNTLDFKDKKILDKCMVKAQKYIDICRGCDNSSSVTSENQFQNSCFKRVNAELYFEITDDFIIIK